MKFEDKIRHGNAIKYYITTQNYISAGRGHIDWIVNAGKNTAYILAGLYFLGIEIKSDRIMTVVLLTLGNLLITFFVGYLWDRLKGFEVAAEWGNKRNPMLREIKEWTSKNSTKKQ